MTPSLVLPGALAAVLVAALASTHRRLPPRLAARLVLTSTVALALAAVATLTTVTLAFLAHLPLLGSGVQWCAHAFGLHRAVSWPWGGLATALAAVGTWRVVRVLRQHRSMSIAQPGAPLVVRSPTPYAFTLPGKGGRVVTSTGLLANLDETERRVVYAHEQAHARLRHDRYLLTAQLAAAAFPPLHALSRRVQFTLERWADEATAVACGDRRLVASALGRAALHDVPPTASGLAGLGVAARMQALLAPPIPRPTATQTLTLAAGLCATLLLSAYQLHHLERLATALCPH